jgi:hypothetical protein
MKFIYLLLTIFFFVLILFNGCDTENPADANQTDTVKVYDTLVIKDTITSDLTVINLESSPISDISFLSALPLLQWINLENCNAIEDISPLANLHELRYLNISGLLHINDYSSLLLCLNSGDTLLATVLPDSIKSELISNGVKVIIDAFALLYPIGGETFIVGDEITIQWQANPSIISSVVVELSIDGGINYEYISLGSIGPNDATSYAWTPTINNLGNNCKIRISDYSNQSIKCISETFTIKQ